MKECNNNLPRDNKGRFLKGVKYRLGVKTSDGTKRKQREKKLLNPTKYWLGKSRNYGHSVVRKDGYVYVSWGQLEDWIKPFFIKYYPRPIQEHRYVWVKENKSEIPNGAVIHHINHNRSDNRIENLIMIESSGEHSRMHLKGVPRDRWNTTQRTL